MKGLLPYLLFCIAATLLSCENNVQEIDALTKRVIEVEEGINIKAQFSQSGNKKAFLSAPLMKRVKADTLYVEFPKSIHVDFFNEQEQLQNVVNAKYARYFEGIGKVFLKDSVVVYNLTGDTLHCKTLWWDQRQENFYTDDSVVVNTIAQQLRGTGFWAKSDFSKYTITNVFGTVAMPGETTDSTAVKPDSTLPAKPVVK